MNTDERERHTEEAPWLDMSPAQIDDFLHMHPTYFMSPKEASDWWAGVDRGIQRSRDNLHYAGSVHGYNPQASDRAPDGRSLYVGSMTYEAWTKETK